jgi:acyl-CoA dehydrogenase
LRVSLLVELMHIVANSATGIYREVPGIRIPGGSEDVMLDLGVRQLVKNFKNKTKALERPSGSSKL